jgi:PIN domain nuclease of toxin-antitoxin system
VAPRLLLDTQALVWGQMDRKKLTLRAREAIEASSSVYVSSITFFEMAQKARLGTWPEIEPMVGRLASMHEKQGGLIVDVDREIAQSAGELLWGHRDPFDRMIAATALQRKLILISADPVFDEVLRRIW